MAIQNKDYFTFLGGEVSPNLFKRVDMRAANKWFETAKNIFFDTTGGFFNRVGTEVIDNNYLQGQGLKLLKFIYNKQQSYEIVFSTNFIKIYKNKALIYTITENIPDLSLSLDIIYTQIGDIMYICFGNTTKIYTLKRFSENNWSFEEFVYNIPPMNEINHDKDKVLHFTRNITYIPNSDIYVNLAVYGDFSNVTISYKDFSKNYTQIFQDTTTTFHNMHDLVDKFNTGRTQGTDIFMIYVGEGKMRFNLPSSMLSTVKAIKVQSDNVYNSLHTLNFVKLSQTNQYITSGGNLGYSENEILVSEVYFLISQVSNVPFASFNNENIEYWKDSSYNTTFYKLKLKYEIPVTMSQLLSDISDCLPTIDSSHTISNYVYFSNNIFTLKEILIWLDGLPVTGYGLYGISGGGEQGYIKYYTKNNGIIVESERGQDVNDVFYDVSCPASFLQDKDVGSIFAIESLYSPSVDGTDGENKTVSVTNQISGNGYLPSSNGFWSNGSWRLVTSGLMQGSLELQYSYDGTTWYTHRSFTSGIKTVNGVSSSTLYNEYGTLDVDDNVKLRLKYSLTGDTNLGITFDTDSFENRGYYRILEKTSSTVAIVECVKYPIGTPTDTYEWAESAWSDTEGYPAICFTYQNRLCFAKTNNNPFVVWTSKTNDYSAFDTKIKYQDDDPITMDVVKFNGVSNIATVAALNKLFVFTEDAEYGIQDQGALTQANKSLISFSKYGAEPLETQVSGNRIVFVENGGKAARQLFYDFAQENYEAPDITVLYKHLLKDEKIIATDYIGLDYRTYLMLTSAGRVICYKYIPEQEITACSWFMHAKGTITNISALDVGNNTVRIYMAVDINGRKQLEVMDLTNEKYLDSRHTFTTDTSTTTIDTTGHFDNGDEVCYFLNGIKHTATIENNTLTLEEEVPSDTSIEVGYPYEAEATLIPMSAIARNGSANYTKKNIFKANFEYFDSVAFKVGMKSYQNEFEEIKYEDGPIGTENTPHSGEKTDIIILSSYLDKNMLSFKQTEPYKMNITNLQVEVDYGG